MLPSTSKSCPFKATPAPPVSLSLCGSNLKTVADAVACPLHLHPNCSAVGPLPGPPDTSLYRVFPGVADTSLSCAALWVLRPRTKEQPLALFKPSACGDAQVVLWGDQLSPARSQSAICPQTTRRLSRLWVPCICQLFGKNPASVVCRLHTAAPWEMRVPLPNAGGSCQQPGPSLTGPASHLSRGHGLS